MLILLVNLKIIKTYGSEAIWPYYYAGTMGLVQRDGINRLRHYFNFSDKILLFARFSSHWLACGTGSLRGPDPGGSNSF